MGDFDNKYNKAYSQSRDSGKKYADVLLRGMGFKPKADEDEEEDKKKRSFTKLNKFLSGKEDSSDE